MRATWLIIVTSFAVMCVLPGLSRSVPATIASVSVVGNSQLGSSEILDWLSSRPFLTLSAELVNRDSRTIVEGYRKRGFLHGRVDSVAFRYFQDSARVDVAFHVHEGRRTVVASLLVSGNTQLTTETLLADFDLGRGDPLDESLLESDIAFLLAQYDATGYPLAKCTVADLLMRPGDQGDSIDVVLVVDEGPLVTINEVRVKGNSETAADVVVRETRLKMGEVFDPEKVEAIQKRLQRLNIFSSVSPPELYLRNSAGGLLIRVQEGRPNTFDGIVGYVPGSSPGQEGYVTGLASIAMRNLFGTGRKFGFRWQREDRFSQELGVNYLEPWVFSYPVNIGFGFFQRQQDSTFVRRAIDLKGEFLVSEEFSVAMVFATEQVIPSADATGNRVFNTSTQTIGAELAYDTRDDAFSPTSGARYRTDYQYGNKKTRDVPIEFAGLVATDVAVQKFGLDLDFFLTTFSRQVIAIGLHGRELRGGQIDEGQMYRFGGTRTLRGYRENQFLGSRIAWTNTEYRFLLARRSFLFGFVDTGYYFRPEDPLRGLPQSEGFKPGYGIGVQVETGLGHLGVSYALGQGDSFSNGKIHFGLINEF